VNFELDDDERALRDGIRNLRRGSLTLERIRGSEGATLDRDVWREVAESGVFSLRVPEADGGAGLGFAAAVVVFEELGRGLVPGPLVGTHLAAGSLLGDPEVVGVLERSRPAVVEYLDDLDALIVVDDTGLSRVDPGELAGRASGDPVDPLTPISVVADLPAGEPIGGPEDAARWRIEGAALTAALLVGIAAESTELAVAYALERHQFGRPIGGFQAVKHMVADMLVRTEVARSAAYAAGATIDDSHAGNPAMASAGAKLLAGGAAFENAKALVQVMGGMGFTWEVPAHLFLKRAMVLRATFGAAELHEEHLASALADEI
jgi:alkylation response protein AidB-like acyl-CoA dehydrogenase